MVTVAAKIVTSAVSVQIEPKGYFPNSPHKITPTWRVHLDLKDAVQDFDLVGFHFVYKYEN